MQAMSHLMELRTNFLLFGFFVPGKGGDNFRTEQFRGLEALEIAIDVQTYRHSAKRLQAISDFFGKLKESKAPETTSETEGLRKLEGT